MKRNKRDMGQITNKDILRLITRMLPEIKERSHLIAIQKVVSHCWKKENAPDSFKSDAKDTYL